MRRMRIRGMSCEGCNEAVAEALMGAGATGVRADFRSGEATFDPGEASDDALRAAVEEAGYRVEDIEETPDREGGPTHRRGPRPRPRYDLLILGSGSAAFAAAIRASDLGASVAVCESNTIGGTCVNVGCVPSKALLAAADLYHRAGHSPFPGVETSAGSVDMAALLESKDQLVDGMRRDKYEHLAEEYGFTLLSGHGRFAGPDRYECDGREIPADQYVIATGASPSVPPIEGLEEAGYLTSTTAFELKDLPESLVCIGANAIGLEAGQLFLHLGSRVTVLEALPRIAPFEEPEVSALMARVLGDEGASVHTGVRVVRVERAGEGRAVTFEEDGVQRRVECEHVLVATGRRPNTRGLGLEEAGVELTASGAVRVDEFMGTTNPRIWAAGDVTGAPQFVYVAAAQGGVAAENAIAKTGRTLDWKALPRVTFTTPQIASVGMTEEEAQGAGWRVESRVLDLDMVPRALVNRDTRGLFKLVAEEGEGRILGVHIVAENAGEVIAGAVFLVKKAVTVRELSEAWCPYLVMAEGLKMAALPSPGTFGSCPAARPDRWHHPAERIRDRARGCGRPTDGAAPRWGCAAVPSGRGAVPCPPGHTGRAQGS